MAYLLLQSGIRCRLQAGIDLLLQSGVAPVAPSAPTSGGLGWIAEPLELKLLAAKRLARLRVVAPEVGGGCRVGAQPVRLPRAEPLPTWAVEIPGAGDLASLDVLTPQVRGGCLVRVATLPLAFWRPWQERLDQQRRLEDLLIVGGAEGLLPFVGEVLPLDTAHRSK